MNYLQLCQRVAQEAGIVGTFPTTTTGQTGELKRIVDWVAEAYTNLQNETNWRWLRKRAVFNTVANQREYAYTDVTDISAGTAISRFKDWRINDIHNPPKMFRRGTAVDSGTTDGATTKKLVDSTQNFTTTINVGDSVHNTTDDTFALVMAIDSDTQLSLDRDIMASGETYSISGNGNTQTILTFSPYDNFEYLYNLGTLRTTTGQPVHISQDQEDNLLLGLTPDDVFTVNLEFHRSAQILATDSDEPEMHSDYHMIIVYMALENYGGHEVAPEVLADAGARLKPLKRALNKKEGPRWRKRGPMA
jgi:hypothetical protein